MTGEGDAGAGAASPPRAGLRRLGLAIGLLLLIAAVAAVWRQRAVIAPALEALSDASATTVALLLLAVVANVVLTGGLFSALMSRYGRVGLLEMQALIAASTLLNYLPLRPGLLGRVAYHRAVNGIPAMHSAAVVTQALAIGAALAAYLAGVAAVAPWLGERLWAGVLLPVPALLAALAAPAARRWATAGLLRYADLLVWAVRYHAAFALIGAPIDHRLALALACVSTVAMSIPFLSNGLGLREWAVGLFAPFLSGATLTMGITAELVNRAAEVAAVAAVGIVAVAWLSARLRRRALSGQRSAVSPEDATADADS